MKLNFLSSTKCILFGVLTLSPVAFGATTASSKEIICDDNFLTAIKHKQDGAQFDLRKLKLLLAWFQGDEKTADARGYALITNAKRLLNNADDMTSDIHSKFTQIFENLNYETKREYIIEYLDKIIDSKEAWEDYWLLNEKTTENISSIDKRRYASAIEDMRRAFRNIDNYYRQNHKGTLIDRLALIYYKEAFMTALDFYLAVEQTVTHNNTNRYVDKFLQRIREKSIESGTVARVTHTIEAKQSELNDLQEIFKQTCY